MLHRGSITEDNIFSGYHLHRIRLCTRAVSDSAFMECPDKSAYQSWLVFVNGAGSHVRPIRSDLFLDYDMLISLTPALQHVV